MIDADGVSGRVSFISEYINSFVIGVTNFFGGLNFIEWFFLIAFFVLVIIYFNLKRVYDSGLDKYTKLGNRRRKF